MQDRRQLTIFVAHASAMPTDHRPHGDGLLALRFLKGLAERGHQIDVATQRPAIRGELPPNLRLHRVWRQGDMTMPEKLLYAAQVRRLYRRLSRTRRYDLVHQLNPGDVGLTLLLPDPPPIVLGPFPVAWPRRRHDPVSAARASVRSRLRRLHHGQAATVLLFIGAAAATVEDGSALAVVPPGIDLDRFVPPGAPPAGPRRILFLASLERRKGIFVLLDAFDDVAAAVPDVELHIAGEGSQRRQVAARVASSPHAARIRLLGPVAHRDVPSVMGQATVFCLPSFGEPFGMSALEAMACGLPLVVTDAGGVGDLVPGDGGAKVPPGDAAALAAGLVDVLRRPDEELARIGRGNRAVAEGYSWDAALDRLEEAYFETIRRTTGAEPTSTVSSAPSSATGRGRSEPTGS